MYCKTSDSHKNTIMVTYRNSPRHRFVSSESLSQQTAEPMRILHVGEQPDHCFTPTQPTSMLLKHIFQLRQAIKYFPPVRKQLQGLSIGIKFWSQTTQPTKAGITPGFLKQGSMGRCQNQDQVVQDGLIQNVKYETSSQQNQVSNHCCAQ